MSDSEVREECSGCSYGPIVCTKIERNYDPESSRGPFWFCDFCQVTYAGNAAIYGERMYPDAKVLSSISAAANLVVAKVEKMLAERER